MKKFIGIILTVFILFTPSLTKDKKISFDEMAAWSYIKVLAKDNMEGRKSGQPGGVISEKYIASKFKEWGLEPAGDNGTYFQNFTIEHRNVGEGVALEIITEKGRRSFYYGEDWRVQRYSGSGNHAAEIVFVGYGIHAPEKKYDDYAGVDVKGKWVFLTSGAPQKLAKKLVEEAKMENRIKTAQELGALGIIAFKPPSSQSRYFRISVKKELYKPDFAILSIDDRVTNFIFKELPTDLRVLMRDIDRKTEPQSMETGVKAFVSLNVIFDEKRPTRNVVGKITGSDKKLKNEYVIIGGHMDHLGINPMGDVMNGANDNASGTAVTMEIARIMKLNRAKPKRTVVFALWAGEEQGLLGSRHYADHPPFPIEKTVAYINMDMVGHGSGKIPFNGVYYGPHIWKVLKEKLPKDILDYTTPKRGGPGGSDHTPFLEKGVPGFFIYTGGLKYHQNRDDSDLIKPEMLKKTGDFVHAAVKILASERGDFFPPQRQETYYLKYQNLINFEFPPLDRVIENHKDAKDSHVDLQLAVIEEKEGLSGDALRADIINTLFEIPEKFKKAKGLSAFSTSSRINTNVRQGKTTVMVGLKGLKSVRDNPKWAQVLAKQGVYFIVVDDASFLFGDQGLNEEGKKIVKALNSSGLLLGVKGLDASQAKALLKSTKKPVILLEKDLPDKEVMKLVKEKECALGLILGSEEDPAAYFKKLDEAKKAIGTRYLMFVNEQCLWSAKGKNQLLKVFSEMLKAKYGRGDLSGILSSTFLRVLNRARAE